MGDEIERLTQERDGLAAEIVALWAALKQASKGKPGSRRDAIRATLSSPSLAVAQIEAVLAAAESLEAFVAMRDVEPRKAADVEMDRMKTFAELLLALYEAVRVMKEGQ